MCKDIHDQETYGMGESHINNLKYVHGSRIKFSKSIQFTHQKNARDMLPRHQITYNDVILPSVLT